MGIITNIMERDGEPYLTRVKLMPHTRWGQLIVHRFHRGDKESDTHDHRWDFWTFPLQDYLEVERRPHDGALILSRVQAYRWHKRPKEHAHRVIGAYVNGDVNTVSQCLRRPSRHPDSPMRYPISVEMADALYEQAKGRQFTTIVWRGPDTGTWGFWVGDQWVPWQEYEYGR